MNSPIHTTNTDICPPAPKKARNNTIINGNLSSAINLLNVFNEVAASEPVEVPILPQVIQETQALETLPQPLETPPQPLETPLQTLKTPPLRPVGSPICPGAPLRRTINALPFAFSIPPFGATTIIEPLEI
jgi:hypothetical protein